jgi:phage shock protein A
MEERNLQSGLNNQRQERRTLMALLERVSTLIRANLNDLIDKAEDPEKMIKQVILDMENQFIQVKTQVAVSMADQHLLGKKQKEHEEKGAEWVRKAELAIDKNQDELARTALERAMDCQKLAETFKVQETDQRTQVENLKSALQKLEQKLSEAKTKRDLLIAQHRRARALGKASDAQMAIGDQSKSATFDRLQDRVMHAEAVSQAKAEMVVDSADDKLNALEKADKIDQLLAEMKSRRRLNP